MVVVQTGENGFDPRGDLSRGRARRRHDPLRLRARAASLFGGGAAEGSGFVLSDDGEIVTNAHVVTDAAAATTARRRTEVYVQFPDRNNVPAEIVGFDPFSDVALLKVDPEGLDLQPLELGDDSDAGRRRSPWRRSAARSARSSRSRSASSRRPAAPSGR